MSIRGVAIWAFLDCNDGSGNVIGSAFCMFCWELRLPLLQRVPRLVEGMRVDEGSRLFIAGSVTLVSLSAQPEYAE
ncbi:uncharacterized protein N7479_000412 [Penicillium vulpinum]|uniref:uncharacterized protein n=1 Tax=Penicillium vulpinum TaxID=29845 RepID=UPI002549A15D|nr:uncharacterized protein N7479_000412 [Penicillium vulpinum]KAJ5970494.1 hypothetical protein N7479_000412 [Penicillium vulpinum]